jgi:hypothetical protein
MCLAFGKPKRGGMAGIVGSALGLYQKHHLDKQDERVGLFRGLVGLYGASSALYPGCFVHVAPSFVLPSVVYVETDRRAARFFADPEVPQLVRRRREYISEPLIRFHHADFTRPLAEAEASFDVLISQYAGFVSRACKRYLRVGGHLVVNNSHGDASMAALDGDFELVAVYRRRGEHFAFSSEELGSYMVPKRGPAPTRADLERTMRGPAFTRPVAGYVFRRDG